MANNLPETPQEFRVGDTLTLSWLWTKSNRKDARVFTGKDAARVKFWYRDATPHWEWAADLDYANGLVFYDLQGVEYQLNTVVYAQAQIYVPDWYVNGATGWAGILTSCDIVSFVVRPAPV